MVQREARGSWIYEILILILLILLMGTILYPKSVWEDIDQETDLCRANMKSLVSAEILYLQTSQAQNYDSSLVRVFEFIKNDSAWQADTTLAALRDSFFVYTIQEYFQSYQEIAEDLAKDSAYALIHDIDNSALNEIVDNMFSDIYACPTVDKTYDIGVVDTSVIKILKVWCPLNETDIDSINNEFMFRVLGGGRAENHGNIDNTEPSWKESKGK